NGVDGIAVARLDPIEFAVELLGTRHEENRDGWEWSGLTTPSLRLGIRASVHAAEGFPLTRGQKGRHQVGNAGGRDARRQPYRDYHKHPGREGSADHLHHP